MTTPDPAATVSRGIPSPERRPKPAERPKQRPAPNDGATLQSKRETDRYYKEVFATPPDFKFLAACDPEFAPFVKGRELDFKDHRSVMQLTKTLLMGFFDIQIRLPPDRLCPPVMNRHNYILWLKDLMDTTSYEPPGRELSGIDIGTGASCIYPLLGCAQRPWTFLATDIDQKNLRCALYNVKMNSLEKRIRLLERQEGSPLLPLDEIDMDTADFCMTNPPFYESEQQLLDSAKKKSMRPFTACTGSRIEMVTEGGEVGFVLRILEESLVLKERVQWYTAMVGFLASLTTLTEHLKEHNINNYAVTEFCQGNKTRRWAIAWSFCPLRPLQSVARGTKAALTRRILPPVTEGDVVGFPLSISITKLMDGLVAAISALELISWDWDATAMEGIGRASDKVWTRAWRRKRKREEAMDDEKTTASKDPKEDAEDSEESAELGFQVSIRVSRQTVDVKCRWLEGWDETAYESFRGFLKTSAMAVVSK